MKQRFVKLLLLTGLALSIICCASTPKKGAEIPDYLVQARTSAENSRAKAIEIKAGVAAKAMFDQGEAGYNAAKTLETASDYEKAAAGYTGAADFYTKAYDAAALKKDAALKSIGKAADERKTSEEALSKAADEQAGNTGKGE